MKKRVISIIGPTGIGKTKLAIRVANHLDTEIISCDARQFFKEMPIGTAMPDENELKQAKHHFIANLSIEDEYSIGQYEIDALERLKKLFEKYDDVVLVGGSGMYEKAVVEGLNNLPESNEEHQIKLNKIWQEQGIEKLQALLKEADPEYFAIVDRDNPRRLLRALDIIWQTGKSYTENIAEPAPTRNFEVLRLGITADRAIIYNRINKRVDLMMENGLLQEAKSLMPFRNKTALQTVGYSELFRYFDGDWALDFAVEEIKKNSRRYAKRQLTWCRKLHHVHWVDYNYSWENVENIISKNLSNDIY